MAKSPGRPRNTRPHEIVLQLPKHALKYQAKRLYWAMLEMEKKMSKDITSVRMTEYTSLLNAYIEVCEKLNKEGIFYGTKARQRMDKNGIIGSNPEREGQAGAGENGSVDLGVGVRAVNPIT